MGVITKLIPYMREAFRVRLHNTDAADRKKIEAQMKRLLKRLLRAYEHDKVSSGIHKSKMRNGYNIVYSFVGDYVFFMDLTINKRKNKQ